MVIKSFEIDYNGNKETIEYEDDLPFGELESIISSCIDMTNMNDIKVKIPQYRKAIFLKSLRKAPFKVNDSSEMNTLPNSVVEQVLKGLMTSFPLGLFLENWVKTITGDIDPNLLESTTFVQESSVGTKTQ